MSQASNGCLTSEVAIPAKSLLSIAADFALSGLLALHVPLILMASR